MRERKEEGGIQVREGKVKVRGRGVGGKDDRGKVGWG